MSQPRRPQSPRGQTQTLLVMAVRACGREQARRAPPSAGRPCQPCMCRCFWLSCARSCSPPRDAWHWHGLGVSSPRAGRYIALATRTEATRHCPGLSHNYGWTVAVGLCTEGSVDPPHRQIPQPPHSVVHLLYLSKRKARNGGSWSARQFSSTRHANPHIDVL